MTEPDKSDGKYWIGTKEFNHIEYGYDVKMYISYLHEQKEQYANDKLDEAIDEIKQGDQYFAWQVVEILKQLKSEKP